MSKRTEEQVDPEQQFILRLPDDIASKLEKEISDVNATCSKLSINIENDYRKADISYDGETIPAKLHDLPCIIESLKTTDSKNYYKTADVCQILIAEREGIEKYNAKKSKRLSKLHLYPHGLTPPLKNVRKSRFRKILKKKYIESPDVENEVKALLRSDLYAVSLPRYELVEDNQLNKDSHDRAELNKLFEEISSDDDDGEEAGIEGYEDADNSAGQLDEQVRLIMKEISEIQQRRQQIKKKLGSMSGSEKINLQEELSLLHSKESTKLMYLEELRSRSRSANAT